MPERDVVLLGIGHTNAHVLRAWRSAPIPQVRLTCVSPFPVATYSGMLPGVLAGQYAPSMMEIDLARLCAAAGARLVVGEATGLDADRRRLHLLDGSFLGFDALSIGIGSVPSFRGVDLRSRNAIVAAKPTQTLLARLGARLRTVGEVRGRGLLKVAVVGGGAAGVELALCLPPFIRAEVLPGTRLALALISGGPTLLPGSQAATARRVRAALARRDVAVHVDRRVVRVDDAGLHLDDTTVVAADVIVWVTGAAPPPLLSALGLPTGEDGFLATDATLRSIGAESVFAVGDTGTIRGAGRAKAGVYAVRQGPVLWRNLRHFLAGAPMDGYRPQASFLKLLNTGDGRAIAEWRGLSFEGRTAWRLKDHIDRSFIARYQWPVTSDGAPGLSPGAST